MDTSAVYEKFEKDRKEAIKSLEAKEKGCVVKAQKDLKFGKQNNVNKPELMLLDSYVKTYKQHQPKNLW
jgi:hypothetical protein